MIIRSVANPVATYKPTPYGLSFMLPAYKYGLFLSVSRAFSPAALKTTEWLCRNSFLKSLASLENGYVVFTITERGADYIRTNFSEILQTTSLYYIHSILLKEIDKIIVTDDLTNKGTAVFVEGFHNDSKPMMSLPKGHYHLMKSEKKALLLASEDYSEKYRVLSYQSRDFLKLDNTNLLSLEEEFNRRVLTPLSNRQLTRELQRYVKDNLKLVEMIASLFDSPNFSNRVSEE